MKLENIKVSDLTPYENNPRNNDEAVAYVARSIKEFGFKVPLVVDANNVIVTGHTRLKAAKLLGIEEVPCIRADDLTPEQVREFRLADNKVGEIATWDELKLKIELDDIDLDMSEFGFDLNLPEYEDAPTQEDDEEDYAEETQDRVRNILNLGYGQFAGAGKYDIPILYPVTELPPIEDWIGFNFMLSEKHPENKGVHFFVDDYQFQRLWNYPERYIESLSRFAAVATPDFSPYGDMPLACQIFNHYRKHWIGAYLQARGVTVIPTIRCSTDPRSHSWFLDGEPKGGIIIMSAMWSKAYPEEAQKEFATVRQKLKPKKVFIYGKNCDMGITEEDNVEFIENFLVKQFGR